MLCSFLIPKEPLFSTTLCQNNYNLLKIQKMAKKLDVLQLNSLNPD